MGVERELTIKAKADGFDEAARKVDELTRADVELKEQLGKTVTDFSGSGGLTETGPLGPIAKGAIKLTLAIKAVAKALGLMPAVSSVIATSTAVVRTILNEVKAREKLAVAIRKQADALGELEAKQRTLQDSIERIAASRRDGGFATPAAARLAQTRAGNAQKRFTQLEDSDVIQVYGLFGDLGLTSEELVDLSLLQYSNQLDIDPNQSNEDLLIRARRQIARKTEQLNKLKEVKTLQGKGLGDVNFRTHQPTEREQKAMSQLGTVGGPKDVLREVLAERINDASFPLDEFINAIDSYGNVGDIRRASVQTLADKLSNVPTAQLRLNDQPGYGSMFLESLGIHPTATFNVRDLKVGVDALQGLGQPTQPVVNNTYNLQNSTFVGPYATSRFNKVTNGESIATDGERF